MSTVKLLIEKEEVKTYNTSLYVDYMFVSVIVLIIIASIFDFNVNGGIINGGGEGGRGRTIKAYMSIICLFQSLFSSS